MILDFFMNSLFNGRVYNFCVVLFLTFILSSCANAHVFHTPRSSVQCVSVNLVRARAPCTICTTHSLAKYILTRARERHGTHACLLLTLIHLKGSVDLVHEPAPAEVANKASGEKDNRGEDRGVAKVCEA